MIIFNGPSWGAYLWRGLYSEGLIYGGKFALQNRLGHLALTVERQVKKLWISFFLSKRLWISFFQIKLCVTVPFLLCFILYLREISKYKLPRAYIRKGRCNGRFFALRVWGLIFGGASFRNFTVLWITNVTDISKGKPNKYLGVDVAKEDAIDATQSFVTIPAVN